MTIELEINELQTQEQQIEQASDQHGEIGTILIWSLFEFVYPHKLGRVFNAQTSFKLQLPGWNDSEIPFAPDLAVEVMSRTDDWSEIAQRTRAYLKAESKLVWVVDPYEQNVFVFRNG